MDTIYKDYTVEVVVKVQVSSPDEDRARAKARDFMDHLTQTLYSGQEHDPKLCASAAVVDRTGAVEVRDIY